MLFGVRMMKEGNFNPTLCSVEGDELPPEGGAPKVEEDPAAAGRLEAIKAIRAEKQALAAKLAAIEAEREAERVKQAEEQGKYQELWKEADAERQALREQLGTLTAAEQARQEAQAAKAAAALEALPENLRALVPEGLSADATLAQVERVKALAPAGPTGTFGGGGKKPTTVPDVTPAEQREVDVLLAKHKLMDAPTALRIIRTRSQKS